MMRWPADLPAKHGRWDNHAHLLACFRSEQMTYAQLAQHMREDEAFAHYVREQVQCG